MPRCLISSGSLRHTEKQFDNICMLQKGMHILLAKWDDRTPGSFQQASTSVPIKSTDLSENTAGVVSQKWIFTQILSWSNKHEGTLASIHPNCNTWCSTALYAFMIRQCVVQLICQRLFKLFKGLVILKHLTYERIDYMSTVVYICTRI